MLFRTTDEQHATNAKIPMKNIAYIHFSNIQVLPTLFNMKIFFISKRYRKKEQSKSKIP